MLKLYLKILFFILFSIINIYAQPPEKGESNKRIQMMKKMKLLEILDLNEEDADKFLIKYNSWEDKLEVQNNVIEKITDDLQNALKNKKDSKTINSLTSKYINEKNKFHQMIIEKLNDFKAFLSEENYAKLLIFEERFYKELGRMMWKMGPGRGRNKR